MTRIRFDYDTPATPANVNKLNNLAIDTSLGTHEEEVVLVSNVNNLFSGEIEEGQYNDKGQKETATGRTRSVYYTKVKANTNYTIKINCTGNVAWLTVSLYDSNHNFLSQLSTSSTNKDTLTFNSGNGVYVNWKTNNAPSTITSVMINEGTTALTYEPPVKKEIYANELKYTDTVSVGVDSNNAGVWVEHSDNLLDKSLLVFNKYLNTSTGAIATSTSGNYYATEEYINISKYVGKTLSLTTSMAVAFYKSDKTFISIQIASASRQVVVPANTVYMRVEIGKDYYSAPMINVGTTLLPYQSFINPKIKVNNNGVYETIYSNDYFKWEQLKATSSVEYNSLEFFGYQNSISKMGMFIMTFKPKSQVNAYTGFLQLKDNDNNNLKLQNIVYALLSNDSGSVYPIYISTDGIVYSRKALPANESIRGQVLVKISDDMPISSSIMNLSLDED